jgi:hypothetical protein
MGVRRASVRCSSSWNRPWGSTTERRNDSWPRPTRRAHSAVTAASASSLGTEGSERHSNMCVEGRVPAENERVTRHRSPCAANSSATSTAWASSPRRARTSLRSQVVQL